MKYITDAINNNDSIKFFIYGPQNEPSNRKYKLSGAAAYQTDSIIPIKATGVFHGKIVIQDKNTKIVDNAIQVTSVTDEERDGKVSSWEKKSFQMAGITIGSAAFSLSVMGASTLAKFLFGISAPWTVTALAVGGVALATFGLMRWYQAKLQVNDWKDPAETVSQNRKKIDAEGINAFLFVFKSYIKNDSIHLEELTEFWKTWKDHFYAQYQYFQANLFNPKDKIYHSVEDQIRKLNLFIDCNPFGSKELNCAYMPQKNSEGQNPTEVKIPDEYLPIEAKFKELETAYIDFRDKAAERKKSIKELKESHAKQNSLKQQELLTELDARSTRVISEDKANENDYKIIQKYFEKDIQDTFKKLGDDIESWTKKMLKSNVDDQCLLNFITPVMELTSFVIDPTNKKVESIGIPAVCTDSIPAYRNDDFYNLPSFPDSLQNQNVTRICWSNFCKD